MSPLWLYALLSACRIISLRFIADFFSLVLIAILGILGRLRWKRLRRNLEWDIRGKYGSPHTYYNPIIPTVSQHLLLGDLPGHLVRVETMGNNNHGCICLLLGGIQCLCFMASSGVTCERWNGPYCSSPLLTFLSSDDSTNWLLLLFCVRMK